MLARGHLPDRELRRAVPGRAGKHRAGRAVPGSRHRLPVAARQQRGPIRSTSRSGWRAPSSAPSPSSPAASPASRRRRAAQAQALVAGQVVAEASSSESACVPVPVTFFGSCASSPARGTAGSSTTSSRSRSRSSSASTVCLRRRSSLRPSRDGRWSTTAGGLGELVVDGEVVASATERLVLCESTVGSCPRCAPTPPRARYWQRRQRVAVRRSRGSPGPERGRGGVVTLQPTEGRSFSTADPRDHGGVRRHAAGRAAPRALPIPA